MQSFTKFWKSTKDAVIDSASSLFGLKKTAEDVPPPTRPPTPAVIFDEQQYHQYLTQATQGLTLKLNDGDAQRNVCDLVATLCMQDLVRINGLFAPQRKSSLTDVMNYCRIAANQLRYEHLVIATTLQFIRHRFGVPERMLSNPHLNQIVKAKALKEQCRRVLFAKEEIRDHLQLYYNVQMPDMNVVKYLSGSHYESIVRLLFNDLVCQVSGIDEAEELCFRALFMDDAEVQGWFDEVNEYVTTQIYVKLCH